MRSRGYRSQGHTAILLPAYVSFTRWVRLSSPVFLIHDSLILLASRSILTEIHVVADSNERTSASLTVHYCRSSNSWYWHAEWHVGEQDKDKHRA